MEQNKAQKAVLKSKTVLQAKNRAILIISSLTALLLFFLTLVRMS